MALYEDILDRLAAGEKVEDIAAYLTKTINDANKAYTAAMEEAKRLQEEEDRKREELVRDKIDAADALIIALENIFTVWGLGDDLVEALQHVDPETLVQEIDKIKELSDEYDKLRRAPVGDRSASALDEFLNKYVR